ncbi:MAG: type II CRISPR RNA-guided endonuclease Cas9 [Oscillospiraceae bacterium]|nr:type II CRISPR RNA-guided endonuclease Cas9 [Oscillospiraceae bacterium]
MKKYLGLDVGTESIGWALTDENYELLTRKKSPMWGVHLFTPADNSDERRKYRCTRRQVRRRKWRIRILQELFNEEISKVDEGFFARLKLQKEGLFTEGDKEYFSAYPTIHHLIRHLQTTKEKPDIRHIYLACSYYMKHRGHFYSNIKVDASFEELLKLDDTFAEFATCAEERLGIVLQYDIGLIEYALQEGTATKTKSALSKALTATSDDEDKLNHVIKLLSNATVNVGDLFSLEDNDKKIKLKDADFETDTIHELRLELGDDFELLEKAKQVMDWVVLRSILKDEKSVNTQRLSLYNYVKSDKELRGAKLDEFMKERHKENRVIPYQLQWADFRKVLDNIARFYPALDTVKIGELFKHKIPYYVGPLKKGGDFAWVEKRGDEKIYPWNFDDIIDKEKTREAFIGRMTAKCTYLVGEDVLARDSLLYAKFVILNQLNNLRLNGEKLDIGVKQRLYHAMYIDQNGTVSIAKIGKWLRSENLIEANAAISGVDTILQGNLKAYHNFKSFFEANKLTPKEAEEIIYRLTVFGGEKGELKNWLCSSFEKLDDGDIKRILRFNYKEYGRLSLKLLEGVCHEDRSIIQMMWETNNNFMELLSDKFTFTDKINEMNDEKESPNRDLNEWLDEHYISNRVKRTIFRSLDIIDEIIEMEGKPDKVFIEMARGEEEKKRTRSRKKELEELLTGNKELLEELSQYDDASLRQKKLFLYFMQKGRCMYTGETISLSTLLSDNWDIDHIWPRAKVKDDSIRNNLVLVDKTANGEKGDSYPLPPDIRDNMRGFWEELKAKGNISEEKYIRLVRATAFSEDEMVNFINRQLVETRQSTKALAQLLKEKYDIKPIYVKAGLVTEFRQQYEYFKCREINDYHHAKDAYLNIVCGNVHDLLFSNVRVFVRKRDNFSVKPEVLYSKRDWLKNDWKENTHGIIRQTMQNNKVKYTEFAFENRGGLWGKTLGLVPRKGEVDGAGKPYELSTCFFALISYRLKGQMLTRLVPIYNYKLEEFDKDKANYFENVYPQLNEKFVGENVKFIRTVKLRSVVTEKGVRYRVTGNTNMSHTYQLVLSSDMEEHLRKLLKAVEKNDYRNIEVGKNHMLFKSFKDKLSSSVYSKISSIAMQIECFDEDEFVGLDIEKQTTFLKNALNLFTANKVFADLTLMGGVKLAGAMRIPSAVDIDYIIDQSPTGFHERKFKVGGQDS